MKDELIEYFIFGEIAAGQYYNLGWDEFCKLFKEKIEYWDFQLYNFDWSMETAEDLLSNYYGWRGWAKITKSEYEQLDKIRNG